MGEGEFAVFLPISEDAADVIGMPASTFERAVRLLGHKLDLLNPAEAQLFMVAGAALSLVNATVENADDPTMRRAALKLLEVMDACGHLQTQETYLQMRAAIDTGEVRQ